MYLKIAKNSWKTFYKMSFKKKIYIRIYDLLSNANENSSFIDVANSKHLVADWPGISSVLQKTDCLAIYIVCARME